MRAILTVTAALILCLSGLTSNLSAQDYRIYTRVFRNTAGDQNQRPEVISRSLTLWHAGKAYDWIDMVGELVIYDPAQQRYTIVSGSHRKGCTVEFSELRHYLKVARSKASDYVDEVSRTDSADAAAEIERIRFQVDPQFEITDGNAPNEVVFSSPVMQYAIQTVPAPNPDVAETFRLYADGAAQLNYMLHGQSSLPGPRLKINEELVRRSLLPVRVQLTLKDEARTVLTAEHSIQWSLSTQDRTRIRDWQSMLQDQHFEFVSFQNYQRAMLEKP